MPRVISIVRQQNDYYIEYKSGLECLRSTKVCGGLESAVVQARDLMNAFINAGLSADLDLGIGLRDEA